MVVEAGGGNCRVGMPGLAGVENTPACKDTVWDKSMVFPKASLKADQCGGCLFVLMAFLCCKCDLTGFH